MQEEIKKSWLTYHPLFETKVSDRLRRCRKALRNWKKKENINARDKIKQLQCALELENLLCIPQHREFIFSNLNSSRLIERRKCFGSRDARINGLSKGI